MMFSRSHLITIFCTVFVIVFGHWLDAIFSVFKYHNVPFFFFFLQLMSLCWSLCREGLGIRWFNSQLLFLGEYLSFKVVAKMSPIGRSFHVLIQMKWKYLLQDNLQSWDPQVSASRPPDKSKTVWTSFKGRIHNPRARCVCSDAADRFKCEQTNSDSILGQLQTWVSV